MNGKELALKENWSQSLEIAGDLIKSGFLPTHIKTPQQAAMIIEMGREIGIPPVIALSKIYVIGQKPALEAQLILQLIYASEKAESIIIKAEDNQCTVTMKRKVPQVEHTETFGIKEATSLFLIGKDNYKKQAKTMYKWRAISACARVVFPDVIGGMYSREELEDIDEIRETTIDVEKSQGLSEHQKETYEDFLKEKFQLIRDALSVAAEPEQVSNIEKGFASDLKMMIEADRQVIETEIDNKYNELISGNKPLSKLEQYKALIKECKDKDSAKQWFKGMQKEIVDNLTSGEFKEFIDFCKTLFPEPKEPCISLTVGQALETKEGATINIMGVLQNAKEDDKKTDYLITDTSGNNKMTIKKWGKCVKGLKQGQTVIFKGVKVSSYYNKLQYTAETIETI